MKVYFEEDGWSCHDGKGYVYFNIYLSPTRKGSAYHFGVDGKKYEFYWAEPENAFVFNHTELPEELWYSISHGVCSAIIEEDEEGEADELNLSKLQYEHVNKEQAESYIEVAKRIKDVKTIDDFKKLYPLIKKSGYVSDEMIAKLFALNNVPRIPVHNGEIGIAFYQEELIYRSLLIKLGLEKAPKQKPDYETHSRESSDSSHR